MLKDRIATAAVLFAVFLSALFLLPSKLFAILIAVMVGVGAYEWSALAKSGKAARIAFASASVGLFAAAVWGVELIAPSRPLLVAVNAAAAAFWFLCVPAWLYTGFRPRSAALMHIVGLLVVLPAGLAMVGLHSVGPVALLLPLGLIWVADIAAYFAGRAFGRHKLAPGISPGKTWEGAAGALGGTFIYAIICAKSIPALEAAIAGIPWAIFLGVTAVLCAISILGDLFESLMKRQAMVKDSGTLLPGHGGVLDRIDSITSTLPVAALAYHLFAGGA